MAQNVTIPGGRNTSGHATGQGVTKSPASSSISTATKQRTNAETVRFVDATQAKHKGGQKA